MVGTLYEERFAKLQHRDSETGFDPTRYRMLSSNQGRWLSPDPAGKRAANPANPQSWNRCAYVLNNACNAVDPLGLIAPGPCLDPDAPGCRDPFLDAFFLAIWFPGLFDLRIASEALALSCSAAVETVAAGEGLFLYPI